MRFGSELQGKTTDLKKNEDCMSCKVMSVLCLLSIGSYLAYRGKQQASMSRYTLYSLGTGNNAFKSQLRPSRESYTKM